MKALSAQELRIGNLVYYYVQDKIEGDHDVLNTIDYEDLRIIFGNGDTDYKPIPLTEEWLLKFGFTFAKKRKTYRIYFHSLQFRGIDNKIRMNMADDGFFYFYVYNATIHIEYVHQLQNLYFALTGNELTIR